MSHVIPAHAQRMAQEEFVHTAAGRVNVSALGRVLMHEHLFCRVRAEHLEAAQVYVAERLQEVASQRVRTIIDLTTYVLPDVFLDGIARVPINIICCAGYYLQNRVPAVYHSLDVAGLADKLRAKVKDGIGSRRVKPGIIKVASAGRTLSRFESNSLRAAGIIQRECGLPVATHACRGGRQQLEVLIDAGANPRKVFLSHVEMELKGRRAREFDGVACDALWILKQGAYLCFNDFSVNDTPYRKKIVRLIQLCHERGFGRQLFISTDSYWSHRRGRFTVRGVAESRLPRTYNYVFTLIIPVLKCSGFSDDDIALWLESNPADFFRGH
jgi:phosphotriesterase-related protein